MSGSRIVVVTGAYGHVGRAVVKEFGRLGDTVVAVGREGTSRKSVLDEKIWSDGVESVAADLTRESEVQHVFQDVVARHRRVDVLVNTVGGYMAGSIEDTTEAAFDEAFGLNLKALLFTCKAASPLMRARKSGKIVNVSTRTALKGERDSFLYAASKAGVNRLTETLADELLASNVQVNCVMPSTIDTPVTRAAMPDADFATWVTLPQIAKTISWLCSDEAAAITGAAIPVYGRC